MPSNEMHFTHLHSVVTTHSLLLPWLMPHAILSLTTGVYQPAATTTLRKRSRSRLSARVAAIDRDVRPCSIGTGI